MNVICKFKGSCFYAYSRNNNNNLFYTTFSPRFHLYYLLSTMFYSALFILDFIYFYFQVYEYIQQSLTPLDMVIWNGLISSTVAHALWLSGQARFRIRTNGKALDSSESSLSPARVGSHTDTHCVPCCCQSRYPSFVAVGDNANRLSPCPNDVA